MAIIWQLRPRVAYSGQFRWGSPICLALPGSSSPRTGLSTRDAALGSRPGLPYVEHKQNKLSSFTRASGQKKMAACMIASRSRMPNPEPRSRLRNAVQFRSLTSADKGTWITEGTLLILSWTSLAMAKGRRWRDLALLEREVASASPVDGIVGTGSAFEEHFRKHSCQDRSTSRCSTRV